MSKRTIAVASSVATLPISLIALIPAPALATTASEHAGCGGYHSLAYNRKLLYNQKGNSYAGEGTVSVYQNHATHDHKRRFCAVAFPAGKSAYMTIQIGTRKSGSTSNPVTWSRSSDYYDAGTVTLYIGGVALTPSRGRCAAVFATMKKGDDRFTRKLTQDLCN